MGLLSAIVGDRKTGDYNLEKKDYHQAIKYYDKALKKDPRDYRAWRGKGKAFNGLGEFEKAYKCFEEVLNINKIDSGAKKGKIDALLELGYEAIEQDNFYQSIEYYQEVLEINHHNNQAFTTTSSSKEILRGKTSELLSGYLDEFLGIRSGDIEALRGIGWAFYFLEEYENAINYFNSILRIRSTDTNARKGKGLIQQQLKQYWQAVNTFNTVLEQEPDDQEALKFRGMALIELKNFEDALICFNHLLKIDESDCEAHEGRFTALIGLADEQLHNKKYKSAWGIYDEYLKDNPNNSRALTGKMECLWFLSEESIEKHDYTGALELIEDSSVCAKALLKDERMSEVEADNLKIFEKSISKLKFKALKELGHQYIEEKKYKESLEYLDSSLNISSDNDVYHERYQVLLELANQCYSNGKFQEGLDYYNKILNENNSDYKALLGKAHTQNSLLLYQDALVILDKLLEYKTNDREVLEAKHTSLSGLGYRFLEKNEAQKALDHFKQGLSIKPDESKSLMGKALALNELKRFAEAYKIFEKILYENPEDKAALKGKGSSLVGQGLCNLEKEDFQNALVKFNAALKIDSANKETLSGKARSLVGIGTQQHEKEEFILSLECFNQALDIEPKNLDALRGKAASLVEIGTQELFNFEFDSAIKIFNQAIESDPVNSDALKGKNKALIGKGSQEIVEKNYAKALNLFDEAAKIETTPDVSSGRYHALIGIGYEFLESRNFLSALDTFDTASNIQKGADAKEGRIEALIGQGNLFLEENNHSQALEYYEEVLMIDPKNKTALSSRLKSLEGTAQINLKNRDYKSALKLFLKILEFIPDDQQSLLGAAQSNYYLNNYFLSLELFERVLNQDPKDRNALKGKLDCYIKIAEQYFTQNEFEKSLDNYEMALTIELNNILALKGKAFVLNQLGKYKDALEIFDTYLKIKPHDKLALIGKANAHVNVGQSFLENNDFQLALKEFNEALSIDSNNIYSKKGKAASLIGLGKIYIKRADYESAYREFSAVLKIEPNNSDALQGKTETLVGIGKHQLKNNLFNESINSFQKALKIDPKNDNAIQGKFNALLGVGRDLLRQLNFKEALDIYNSCLTIKPNNPKALDGKVNSLIGLGNKSLERNDYHAAFKEFNLVLIIKSKNTDALNGKVLSMLGIANKSLKQKNLPEALRFYNEVLEIQPKNDEAISGWAKTQIQIGNNQLKNKCFEDAIESFQKSLQIEPKNQEAIHGKAKAYIGMGKRLISLNQPNDALKYFDNALKLHPNELEALTSKGIALNLNGDFKDSLNLFNELLSSYPSHNPALEGKTNSLVSLGKAFLVKEDYENAIKNFNEAISIDGNNKNAIQGKISYFVEFGNTLLKKRQYNNALECFNQAINLETHNKSANSGKVKSLLGLGKDLLSAEKYDNALEIFGKALKTEPNNQSVIQAKIEALYAKGLILYNNKEYDSAVNYFDKILQIQPGQIDASTLKAKTLVIQGNKLLDEKEFELALDKFEKSLDLSENKEALDGKIASLNGKAEYHTKINDFKKSLNLYESVLLLDENNITAFEGKLDTLLKLGENDLENENYRDAKYKFQYVLKNDQNSEKAIIGLLNSLIGLQRYEESLKLLEKTSPDDLEVLKIKISVYLVLGTDLLNKRQFTKSLNYFQQVLSLDEGNFEAIRCEASALYGLKNFEKSLESFERCLKIIPDDEESLKGKKSSILGLAKQNLNNENYNAALDLYEKVLQIDSNNKIALKGRTSSLLNIGYDLINLSKFKEALEVFENILETEPGNKDAHEGIIKAQLEIGYVLLKECEYLSSLQIFQDIIRAQPKNRFAQQGKTKALIELGKIEWENHSFDRAIDHFEDALEIEPENQYALTGKFDVLLEKGKSSLKNKDYQSAMRIYGDALQIDANSSIAISGRIKALLGVETSLLESAKYDEAINCLNQALKLEPENSAILSEIDKVKNLFDPLRTTNHSPIKPTEKTNLDQTITNNFKDDSILFVGGGLSSSRGLKKIAQINFGLLSPENIRKMSVIKIVTPDTYDEDGYPIEAGLMDPRLGVINPGLRCPSCGSKGGDCDGHFGHINLARPLIHVGFADTIHMILRSTCSSCGKVLLTNLEKEIYMGKLEARFQNEENITEIIKEIYTLARRDDCPHCHQEAEIWKNAEFMIQSTEEILEEMDQVLDTNSKKKIKDLVQKLVELKENNYKWGLEQKSTDYEKLIKITDVTDDLIRAVKGIEGKTYENTLELRDFIEPIYQEAKRAQQRTIQEDIIINQPVTLMEGNYKLTPSEVREWLEKIPEDDYYLLGINPKLAKLEWMVLTVLPVPPVTIRPTTILKSGAREEDDLTHKLVDILRINQRLKENMEAGAPQLVVKDLWELLQYHVTTYFDNEAFGIPPARHRSGRPLKTLVQRLKGKEGRFRSNLSGKRVNFSARTVVSPDPNISINEVGVPEMIATEVTVPVYVTEWNIDEMKKHIENGSKIHPGANYVIRPDERKIRVYDETKESILEKLEPGYVVERHLMDGDIVLFNRQPSLHRMSMMAHKVKVLPHKTFRINPAVATPYNVNFGGDLMNLHVMQTAEAIAEAKTLMLVQENFTSPRFGGPIIGGIHDHISGGYLLTRDGSVFKEEDIFQMVQKSQLPTPEPRNRDWTGKEIFSLLLPDDLHMVYKAEICRKCDECLREQCKNDAYVVIENGELKMGAIDEKAIGAISGKILDSIVKEYGTDRAREFLDSATKLSISGIMKRGFTTSTADEKIPQEAKDRIKELLSNAEMRVEQLIEDYHNEKLEALPGRSLRETLEMKIMQVLGEARDKSGEIAESYFGKDNHAVIMALTGARGSMLNLTQIAACVGQQSVRGGRIERGYRNRTLPHFQEGELGAKASGFVHSSYKSGLDPLEFFFHAMGGRDVLVNREIRTAQSGYMQRRLIYALQDLTVKEDGTVRDNRGVVIQTRYGEDGIDPAKSDYGKVADIDRLIEEMRIKANANKSHLKNQDMKINSVSSISTLPDKLAKEENNHNLFKSSIIPEKKVIGDIEVNVHRITEKGETPAQWEVYFDGKLVDFYSLGFYEPKSRVGDKQKRFSKEILNFKKEIGVFSNPTAEKFAYELIRMITKNHLEFDIIIPIPGSSAGKISNGHKRLTSIISKHLDILDGTGILQRVNSVKKSAWSGNDRPSLEEHYDSISCEEIVHNKRILLFDDVLTKGNTAAACVLKIYDNDPGDITIMTLGKTV